MLKKRNKILWKIRIRSSGRYCLNADEEDFIDDAPKREHNEKKMNSPLKS